MMKRLENFEDKGPFQLVKRPMTRKGLSVLEILLVIAIIGALTVLFYPRVMNTQEKRELENTARDVLTTLQHAKFQAVKTKINHRVSFVTSTRGWIFTVEKQDDQSQWNEMQGFMKKTIPSKYVVTVNLPGQAVVFSPLGFIANFSSSQNSITLQSPKLKSYDQPDLRIINVFAGGSVQYTKSQS